MEVRERAVRLVLEHAGEYASQWAAITSIAAKCGMTPETSRRTGRRFPTLRPSLRRFDRPRTALRRLLALVASGGGSRLIDDANAH